MIENDKQLEAALQNLGGAYLSLAALRRELLPSNPQRFASSSQPVLRQIGRLRADIDQYLGLEQAERGQAPPPFVIENEEQLRGTHRALGHLYVALAALRKHLPPTSRNYRLYAEGNIEEILKLQAEIDAYLGLIDSPETVALRESPPAFGDQKRS